MTKNVLDIGCGGGKYLYHSAIAQNLGDVLNLDVEIPRIKISPFIRADVRHLPFQNNSFDVAYLYAVLEHTDKPLEGLKECLRVSRRGVHVRTDGLLFLPNWTTPDHKFFTLGYHFIRYPQWLKMLIINFIAKLLINKFTLPLLRRAKMMNDLDYYSARWNYYFYAKTNAII
jgi:ubiquinone/menaquinone biosynthesis C-methylase UbiE